MKRGCVTTRSRLGYSLIEMVLSLTLLSLVMATVSSAVIFAGSASQDEDGPEMTLAMDGRAISQIAEDLSLAGYLLEQSDNTVTIVVADRTGDGNPDRIRYAWSGKAGDPLTYQINDDNAINLLDSTASFELDYTLQAVASALPNADYYGSETTIEAHTKVDSESEKQVKADEWFGQVVTPSLSSGSHGFMPTRLLLYASGKAPYTGQSLVSLKDRSGSTPGNTTFASQALDESKLDEQRRWWELAFDNASFVSNTDDIGFFVSYVSGQDEVLNVFEVSSGGGKVYSQDSGVSWTLESDKSLLYQLFGRERLTDTMQHTVSQTHMVKTKITLQSVAANRSPLIRTVRMMLAPTKLDMMAQTGFDADPTTADIDGNGKPEWNHSAGTFPATSLGNGLWVCDGQLIFQPDGLSSMDVIRIATRMRSNDTLGPAIYGPYTVDASDQLLPIMTQLRSDGGAGQELVVYNDTELSSERLVIGGLPSGLIDIGLTLLPGEDYLYIEINHEPAAAIKLDRVANDGTVEQAVWFGSTGGVAEFGSITVRVGGSYVSKKAFVKINNNTTKSVLFK